MNRFSQRIHSSFNNLTSSITKKLSKGLFKGLVISSAVVSLWGISLPAQAVTYNEAYRQAYQDYLSAVNEESGALERALEELTSLHQANPNDPLALNLLGASHTLVGRDAWMPWNKLKATEKGLELMANATRLLTPKDDQTLFLEVPVTVQVKGMAGVTYTQVPEFFNRFDQGVIWLDEALATAAMANVPAQRWAYLHYFRAQAAEQEKDLMTAQQHYQSVGQLLPGSNYAKVANEWLAKQGVEHGQ